MLPRRIAVVGAVPQPFHEWGGRVPERERHRKRAVLLPGGGHCAVLMQPAAFLAELLACLGPVSAATETIMASSDHGATWAVGAPAYSGA